MNTKKESFSSLNYELASNFRGMTLNFSNDGHKWIEGQLKTIDNTPDAIKRYGFTKDISLEDPEEYFIYIQTCEKTYPSVKELKALAWQKILFNVFGRSILYGKKENKYFIKLSSRK